MKAVQSILDTLFADHDNWKITLLKEWPAIIGSLHTKVRIEKIADDQITLAVSDSSWLQELYLMSAVLQHSINKKLDRPRIKHIHFKLAAKKEHLVARKPYSRQLPQAAIPLTPDELQSLQKVQDEALKQALANFLRRCKQE